MTVQGNACVGLDLRPTEPGFKAHFGRGTGRYTAELAKALAVEAEQLPQIDIKGLGSGDIGAKAWEQTLLSMLPFGRRTFEQQLLMPNRYRRCPVDLLHFFSHADAPVLCRQPYMVTVLDLIPLRFPDLYRADKPNWRFKFARKLEDLAVQRAKGILAISQATKRDVVELMNVPPERVFVTELAVDERFAARSLKGDAFAAERAAACKEFGLAEDRPALLYLGGIDARKNVLFLLEVFAELLQGSSADRRPQLVLGGAHAADDKYDGLCRRMRELAIADDVVELGFVADERLPKLYHAADVFVFPSIYEGFGLPVLEAMASAVPVAAGNNSSIPEVCGDELPLLPDNDRQAWVRELKELIESESLRRRRSELGHARSKLFSWQATARKTLEAYRLVLSDRKA